MKDISILLVGDSFGTERVHHERVDVPLDRTWPVQVRNKFDDIEVFIDFKKFRRLVECPPIIEQYDQPTIVVVQAGIVDCFPRPLTFEISTSKDRMSKLLREFVRPIRGIWMSLVYRTTYSSTSEIRAAIERLIRLRDGKSIFFITASPQNARMLRQSPGARQAILDFNELLRSFVSEYSNAHIIDLHHEMLIKDYNQFLHPKDSHLNQLGNDMLAELVIKALEAEMKNH